MMGCIKDILVSTALTLNSQITFIQRSTDKKLERRQIHSSSEWRLYEPTITGRNIIE
jgi:hypothetical protein